MEELFTRIWENLGDRVTGPMWLRLVLQPIMAAIFAVRAGLEDARQGNPAYFWTLLTNPEHRVSLIREGWSAIAKVFLMAMVMDTIYQWIVQRWIHAGEIVIVAFLLAVVPYILIRGPLNRLVRTFRPRTDEISERNG